MATTRAPELLEPLLSVPQTLRVLGISQRTLYRLIRDGELRPIRIGDRVLFDPADLRDFIDSCRVPRAVAHDDDGPEAPGQ